MLKCVQFYSFVEGRSIRLNGHFLLWRFKITLKNAYYLLGEF